MRLYLLIVKLLPRADSAFDVLKNAVRRRRAARCNHFVSKSTSRSRSSPPGGDGLTGSTTLHTHFADGVIHIEAPTKMQFTLGQFFREWGVRLDGSCVGGYCWPAASVAVFVDGKRQTGNPASILLLDHDEMAIVIGTPPAQVPATHEFLPSEP
jgi:hypothetical protein